MTSHTTEQFRKVFGQLPVGVQRQARSAYALFQQNADHPSLNFKPVNPKASIYSVRVGRDYRALGVVDGGTIVWFWIGSHDDYEKLISRL